MGRTACTEPECLYKGDLYLYLFLPCEIINIAWHCENKYHLDQIFPLHDVLCHLQSWLIFVCKYSVCKCSRWLFDLCQSFGMIIPILPFSVGTAVAQWLRCCATNRKIAGSITDGVIGIFHWHNPSDRTMTLGSTQPLTEMSTSRISWW